MQKSLRTFASLGLSEKTLEALRTKGFEIPTEIQIQAVPLLLNSETDLVGQAQTGTGKTAAFGIPLLETIRSDRRLPQAVILVPTRELAIQVSEELNSLQGSRGYVITPIYGGQPIGSQIRTLKRGVHILVGTPGRVLDHLSRKTLDLSEVTHAVLDEADEMLNQGFIEDIETILSAMPKQRRTALFSATMPKRILTLAETYMRSYEQIVIREESSGEELTEQTYIEVREQDKLEALCRIIDSSKDFYGLVFCRTKADTDKVAAQLKSRGYRAEALHGDISQGQREKILDACRKRWVTVLAATDVAARGLDIPDLTHVVNYAVPFDAENYLHRTGRTGRAGKTGTAVSLVTPLEARRLLYYRHILKLSISRKNLPKVSTIVSAKRYQMQQNIREILQEGAHRDYLDAAQLLVDESSPVEVIASLLKHTSQNDLCESHYRKIPRVESLKPADTRPTRNNRFSQRKPKKFRNEKKKWKSRAS